MNTNTNIISNNESDTEVSKHLYPINAANYVNGLLHDFRECKESYHKTIVKMENNKAKLSKHEKKVSHYQEKVRKYRNLSSSYQNDVNFNDDLIVEFFSDKRYPWLYDDSLTDEDKNQFISIAHKLGMCPYCDDDEFDAEKLAA